MATSPTGFVDRQKGKSKSDQNFYSVQTNIVASTTQTQGGATPLTAQNCFVATCATLHNALRLPMAQAGMEITVIVQATAFGPDIWPAPGDQINALGLNTALNVAASTITIFYCGLQGSWFTK
jgi:hypothetical protein